MLFSFFKNLFKTRRDSIFIGFDESIKQYKETNDPNIEYIMIVQLFKLQYWFAIATLGKSGQIVPVIAEVNGQKHGFIYLRIKNIP